MSQSVTRLYTTAEFENMPELDMRYELLDGRLIEKPGLTLRHADIKRCIMIAYFHFDPDEKTGIILSTVSVGIDTAYVPAPDLSFWIANRRPHIDVNIAPYPDLAIEVESKWQGLPELLKKAERYLAAGVRLVWIIQPDKRSTVVIRPGQQIIIQPTSKLEGEDVIPGFEVKLNDLFRK